MNEFPVGRRQPEPAQQKAQRQRQQHTDHGYRQSAPRRLCELAGAHFETRDQHQEEHSKVEYGLEGLVRTDIGDRRLRVRQQHDTEADENSADEFTDQRGLSRAHCNLCTQSRDDEQNEQDVENFHDKYSARAATIGSATI